MTTRQGEILRARSEASRAHVSLNIDPDQPIDVFAAIRRAGLWLVFNKLDGLLGAMSREGVGGIMVNPARPIGLQRYTAAHELGHWYLHDATAVVDTDETMMRDGSLQEIAAQEFAAAFLMPRRLVNHTLRTLGVAAGGTIDGRVAYGLARNLGVSYEASLIQLQRMHAITFTQRQQLARLSPSAIKSRLAGGRTVPTNSQVWTPTLEQLDNLTVTLGDEIAVSLPENRTTGYQWEATSTPELPVVDDHFVREANNMIGSTGTRNIVFRAEVEGTWQQSLPLRRFSPESPPAQIVRLSTAVQLSPERRNALILASPTAQLP